MTVQYRYYSAGAPHAERGRDAERGHRVLVLDPVPLQTSKDTHVIVLQLQASNQPMQTDAEWKQDVPCRSRLTYTHLLFQIVDELGELLVGCIRRRRLPRGHGHHVPRRSLAWKSKSYRCHSSTSQMPSCRVTVTLTDGGGAGLSLRREAEAW